MPEYRKVLIALSAVCLVTACASTRRNQVQAASTSPARTSIVSGDKLPAPDAVDAGVSERRFFIGPLDRLTIDVLGLPDFGSREVQTDASGRLSFPLAGVIDAAGKTPTELAAIIAGRLRQNYVRNPQVTVNLKETVSQVITVDGEVREPGSYPIVGTSTLLRAVAAAKGTTESALQSRVLILRKVGGLQYAGVYNLKSIRRGDYEDPQVFVNDVVVVGDNAARRLLRDALTILPAITTPAILLLR